MSTPKEFSKNQGIEDEELREVANRLNELFRVGGSVYEEEALRMVRSLPNPICIDFNNVLVNSGRPWVANPEAKDALDKLTDIGTIFVVTNNFGDWDRRQKGLAELGLWKSSMVLMTTENYERDGDPEDFDRALNDYLTFAQIEDSETADNFISTAQAPVHKRLAPIFKKPFRFPIIDDSPYVTLESPSFVNHGMLPLWVVPFTPGNETVKWEADLVSMGLGERPTLTLTQAVERVINYYKERGIRDELTGTQEKTAQAILEALDKLKGRGIVILEGFSGTGKTKVLNSIKNEIELRTAGIDEHLTYSERIDPRRPELLTDNITVATVTVGESEELKKKISQKYPSIPLITSILQGGNLEESLSLVRTLRRSRQTSLTDDEIANVSLGIPLLIKQLLLDPNLTYEEAVKIVGNHIGTELKLAYYSKEDVSHFIQIPPSLQVLEVMDKVNWRREGYYGFLGDYLEERDNLQRRGIFEESPRFLAAESALIYKEMVGSRKDPDIDIFVPEMRRRDYIRIMEALRYRPNDFPDSMGSRAEMFGFAYRKYALWLKGPKSREVFDHAEYPFGHLVARQAEEDFLQGLLPLKPSDRPNFRYRLFFHKHDHIGLTSGALYSGWMVESLLQQRDIAYMVDNWVIGKHYVYHPENQAIEYATFDISDLSSALDRADKRAKRD